MSQIQFKEIEKKAESQNFPIIGPIVGNFIAFITKTLKAKRIIELGSGYGYSGLWFAGALPADGHLILTDFSEEYKVMAIEYFRRAGMDHLIEFRVGESLEILKQEQGPFDVIFNDIDKEDYPKVINLSYERLRKGGLLITDNTLWYGRVISRNPDETTKSIQEFNQNLKKHRGFNTVQLPIRDGISVSIKT